MGNRIIKLDSLLKVGPGRSKLASVQHVPTGGEVTQDEPSYIVVLVAQTQQIFVEAPRQIELAAAIVIEGLPIRNVEELRGITQLRPKFSPPGEGMPHFRRRLAFGESQGRAERAPKLKLLLLALAVVWQQGQLVQPLLELRGCFGH